MPIECTAAEIRQKYNRFARQYDLWDTIPGLLGEARLRRRLLRRAAGQVLEVAAGTGKNLPYYPRSCQITAVDLSPAMLERARKRAGKRVTRYPAFLYDG